MKTLKKYSKILFAIVPKFFWIALVAGFLLRFIGEEYIVLSDISLQLVLTIIFLKLGVIIHESGHLLMAKIMGGKPRRMVLGSGYKIVQLEIFNIKIIVKTGFISGKAFATFGQETHIKTRLLLFATGGILANMLSVGIIYLVFGFDPNAIFGEYGIDMATAFIFSGFLLILISLIPFRVNNAGIAIPNDGLSIFTLPFQKAEKVKAGFNYNELLDALDFYENKEFDKALEIFKRLIEQDPSQISLKINMAAIYLKKGDYQKSLEIYSKIEEVLHQKKYKPYLAMVSNNLAWLYLLENDIENADKYSKNALALNKDEKGFRSTRGSVLIEKGKVQDGIYHLIDLVDFKYPNNETLSAAMYLSYGFYLQNNKKEAKKYARFVQTNTQYLDKDEELLWEQIKERNPNIDAPEIKTEAPSELAS